MGACPWKLAMLASAITVWDLMWEHTTAPADPLAAISVTEDAVTRAFGLLEILESVVCILGGATGFQSGEESTQGGDGA